MNPNLLPMCLAALLLACGGDPADSATHVDTTTGSDTSTSGVTPEDCTSEQVYVNACTGCGPTDGCTGFEAMCLATCPAEQEGQTCADGGFCTSGVCLSVVCG
jgi:hypothetical protein